MPKIYSVFIALILSLSCLTSAWAQISAVRKVPNEALKFNESVLQDLLKRDVDSVLDKALIEFRDIDNVESELTKYMGYLPAYEEGKNYKAFEKEARLTVGIDPQQAIYRTRYELTDINISQETDHKWVAVDIYSQETEDGLKFRHFNFKTYSSQPTAIGNFDIKNKSFKHYIFLSLLILMPIFIIFTIVAIIRNKHMTKKWLWAGFAAFGLWGVNFNWITGKISTEFITMTTNSGGVSGVNFKLISFKLLGASIVKSSQYSPFIITIALPLGAILYWTLKHRDKTIPQEFE